MPLHPRTRAARRARALAVVLVGALVVPLAHEGPSVAFDVASRTTKSSRTTVRSGARRVASRTTAPVASVSTRAPGAATTTTGSARADWVCCW